MDAQILLLVIGQKVLWVMYAHYLTCGVTRLRGIDLLSTTSVRSMREIHPKSSGKIKNVSEKK